MEEKMIRNRAVKSRLLFQLGELRAATQIWQSLENLASNTYKNAMAGKSDFDCLRMLSDDINAIHTGVKNLVINAQSGVSELARKEHPDLAGLQFSIEYLPGENDSVESNIKIHDISLPEPANDE